MIVAAEDLRFEEAARIRDELRELRRDLEGMRPVPKCLGRRGVSAGRGM